MRSALLVLVAAAACVSATAVAKPHVPVDDAVVLERLPEKGDPTLARLKRLRAALRAKPRDLDIALPVARLALDAARILGDPRFLGQAQAALAPWWQGGDVPPAALLERASVKQSQHDFAGALADLDRLVEHDPALAQARLTRATVFAVVGRYADARRDCAALRGRATRMIVAGCDATPASLSGHAGAAYGALVATLADPRGPGDVREWALTLAAEIAARRGDFPTAEGHFRDALALDPRDGYLKGAYADFLLDRNRPREILPLLRDDTRNDALLLRLVLAEQRLADQCDAFSAHRTDLARRFEAARRRGDSLHRREEARFLLAVENDPHTALTLARDNWAAQREPADLRVLIEAARATGDSQALGVAMAWIAANHIEGSVAVTAPETRR